MVFFQGLAVLFCSMVSVLVFFGLSATRCRLSTAEEESYARTAEAVAGDAAARQMPREVRHQPDAHFRPGLLWVGLVVDTTAAVFAGSWLGLPWLPALLSGLLFYVAKIAGSELFARRLNRIPARQLTVEEKRNLKQAARQAYKTSSTPAGWLPWLAFALVNLLLLLLLMVAVAYQLLGWQGSTFTA